ncbi:MAG: histidinol-phosphate transaminase [Flavobacterium sp.]|jgi:histidinol-phosphate aminotransferase|uniref:histidinol-phosphate transaminase n=1 Tax=Flavobacterium sp. TaxID=239 RepID=UPI0022C4E275|nr:histidinol-phosphate transaminase [Flavobacterium sp.]MCZ8329687.1 histidinol-phosphate transaminase [Flavobacterium sp.]
MDNIINLIRKNILSLTPYSSARDEYKSNQGIFLDANENPFGNLNRYPDPYQWRLKQILSSQKKVGIENILIGNGSDEIIDLVQRVFCEPNEDKIIICPPTYGMYEVYGNINNLEIISIPLTEDFQLNTEAILAQSAKILYLCSPNNPTGNSLEKLGYIIENFNGIVFLDEAYIDFSEQPSLVSKIKQFPNLIVSQTFSKARGLAAVRIGIAYANETIISMINKVKPPYNVSQLNQEAAVKSLASDDDFKSKIQLIISEREILKQSLLALDFVTKIYPSDANFLLVEMENATAIYNSLIEQQIITRNRSSVVENTIRITIGTPRENQQLIYALQLVTS